MLRRAAQGRARHVAPHNTIEHRRRLMDNARPFLRGFPMTTRRELANCIRALSMDAVQRANSGHPGMPMGMADIAQVLWSDFLKHNPGNPQWPDRDRFLLSNGHGSMLLYSLLHLTGYPLGAGGDREFPPARQPYGGPPGARARRSASRPPPARSARDSPTRLGSRSRSSMLAAQFNRPGFAVVDHYTYVFCGDGCLMEGHLPRGLLPRRHAAGSASSSPSTTTTASPSTARWRVGSPTTPPSVSRLTVGMSCRMSTAMTRKRSPPRSAPPAPRRRAPRMICCRTIIGWGAPHRQGTAEAHGEALGADEVAATRKAIGWPYEPFVIPAELRAAWDHRGSGAAAESAWRELLRALRQRAPGARARARAPHARRAARGLERDRIPGAGRRARAAGAAGDPPVLAGHAQRDRAAHTGDFRRLGRSHRVQQHQVQGRARVRRRRKRPATTSTTACASSA